jgi:predicted enzyme related to lactoylglutathione lyase
MTDVTTTPARPVWVDLATPDVAASSAFYSTVLGWDVAVSPDPQYGGYAMGTLGGEDVAGIGPKMSPDAPTAWSIYIGTTDVDALAGEVDKAGGRVIAPPFDVGDQGRMAVFQDPAGAFISAWQPIAMRGFAAGRPGAFGWAELNARGFDRAAGFYRTVFGWEPVVREVEGAPPYTEFHLGDDAIAGGMEMMPMVPAEVPSYWLVYFAVDDVDAAYTRALDAGAREMLSPVDFPGGRLAIVSDPQGAMFGLLRADRM